MKRRFLAFLVCMAVLLASFTGCYSAQKDGPSTASSAQTAQLGSGSGTEESVEIRTYVLPEENVRADSIYVPSPSTGGFWTCAVFNAKTIQAYDPATRTTYFPCYQAGCKHTIFADTELKIIEVQLGKAISVEDKQKYPLPQA